MNELYRLAEARLNAAGTSTDGMSDQELFHEAITTSDFPLLMGNSLQKRIKKAYLSYPTTYLPWTTQDKDIPDFRAVKRSRVTANGDFEVVPEGTPYPEMTAAESQAGYAIKKWGRLIKVTLETLINDDTGEISRQVNAIGSNGAETVNSFVYDQLKSNPTIYDGKPLFHTDHGNLGTAAALDADSLIAALVAMLQQKKEGSNRAARIIPRYLIVPTPLYPTALKLLAERYIPAEWNEDNAQVFKGIQILHEPELNDDPDRWYLGADPVSVDTFEVGFLRGTGGNPEVFRKEGFDNDTQLYKARHVFGGSFLDFRGLYATIPA